MARGDIKHHVRRVLGLVEPDLFPDEMSQLTDEVESSLAAYASQADKDKKESQKKDELKEHRQKALKTSISIALNSLRNSIRRQSPQERAEKRLRIQVRRVLTLPEMNLSDEEVSKIEDRMISLMEKYAAASGENRYEVYKRGEEEVFAVLSPPAKSFGAGATFGY